jgi:hypothetical protein
MPLHPLISTNEPKHTTKNMHICSTDSTHFHITALSAVFLLNFFTRIQCWLETIFSSGFSGSDPPSELQTYRCQFLRTSATQHQVHCFATIYGTGQSLCSHTSIDILWPHQNKTKKNVGHIIDIDIHEDICNARGRGVCLYTAVSCLRMVDLSFV